MEDKSLQDLRDRRKAALDAADALVTTAENETRGVTEDEQKSISDYLAEAQRCKEALEASDRARLAREAIDSAKRDTVPDVMRTVVVEPAAQTREVPNVTVGEEGGRTYQKGDALGAIVSARLRFGGWEQNKAVAWASRTYGERSPQARALQQSNFTAGGAFIPENFVGSEFIDMLKATARVRGAGARTLTLVNGSATVPKLVTGASGGWIGSEGDNAVPSEPTTGQVKLVEKKYMVLVPISNDLRRTSSLEMERVVRDDMVANTANAEDQAFLNGSGLAGQPKGIYNWVPAAGKANSAGTALANVRTDIRTAKNRLGIQNAPNIRRAWFMHSRSSDYMGWELVDGNSNFAFPQMQQGQGANLGGGTVNIDNNISVTLGGSSNASQIFYVEMSECFIGDSLELELELIENAVYADAAGTLRSGVSRDESAIRLIRKTDFGMRHTESAFVLEAVTYGA